MPIHGGSVITRTGAPLREFPASLGQVLGAQAQDTRVHNPTSALIRLGRQRDAELGTLVDPGDPLQSLPPVFDAPVRVDAETARARVREEGFPQIRIPDAGISEQGLRIIIDAKRAEAQRQSIFERGPTGVGVGALRLGTALLNSIYDPLNIASAFVPVVGPARYTALIGGATSAFGRAGVRAGVGAAEGAVGAAILEPLIYSAAQGEQLDYEMTDSLANIAFGALFGGGLHAGAGAVRDVVQPGWWRMAQPVPGAAAAEIPPGIKQSIDATPDIVPARERAPGTRDALEIAQNIADAEARPGFLRSAEDLLALRADRSPEIDRAVEILKTEGFLRSAEDRVFLEALRKGYEQEYINDRVGELLRGIDEIDQAMLARGNSPESEGAITAKRELVEQLDAAVARLDALGAPINQARLVAARVSPETREAALRAAVAQAMEGRQIAVDALIRTDAAARDPNVPAARAYADALEEARRSTQADRSQSGERSLPRAPDGPLTPAEELAAAEAELAEVSALLDDVAAGADIRDEARAAMAQYDAEIRRTEQYGAAMKAGAACGVA
jgi:hypothetical protein